MQRCLLNHAFASEIQPIKEPCICMPTGCGGTAERQASTEEDACHATKCEMYIAIRTCERPFMKLMPNQAHHFQAMTPLQLASHIMVSSLPPLLHCHTWT
ncbi:TPA: hypothetical protein ACH3X3_009195 [Trebouxia sp. C0006]